MKFLYKPTSCPQPVSLWAANCILVPVGTKLYNSIIYFIFGSKIK